MPYNEINMQDIPCKSRRKPPSAETGFRVQKEVNSHVVPAA